VIDVQFVGIEVKAPKGKKSGHQKELKAKGKYILAYSLDDVVSRL
jgi:hypothetical protein